MKFINWLFWQFQKRCEHNGLDGGVAAMKNLTLLLALLGLLPGCAKSERVN